jgi:hypothetical protein
MVLGLLLMLLGFVGFIGTDAEYPAALLPVYFGLALVLLGLLGQQDRLRKHAMHTAAMVGLIGVLLPTILIVLALTAEENRNSILLAEQVALAAACALFVALCVKSFIDARRRQRQKKA